jgi:hypothetical protein
MLLYSLGHSQVFYVVSSLHLTRNLLSGADLVDAEGVLFNSEDDQTSVFFVCLPQVFQGYGGSSITVLSHCTPG